MLFVCMLCLQLGGMGFVHYNNTPQEQLDHVLKAKKHIPGFVVDPVVMGPTDTVGAVEQLKAHRGISSVAGFSLSSSVCVTDTGRLGGKLLGIVTTSDYEFLADKHTPLAEVRDDCRPMI